MKTSSKSVVAILLFMGFFFNAFSQTQPKEPQGYLIEKEHEIAVPDSIHFGEGLAIGYSFFQNVDDFKYVFRKRILKPGAEIRYHLQRHDEVYYILSGKGEMNMNGKTFPVEKGDAILTRPGNYHGLKQTGFEDLDLIIAYEQH